MSFLIPNAVNQDLCVFGIDDDGLLKDCDDLVLIGLNSSMVIRLNHHVVVCTEIP